MEFQNKTILTPPWLALPQIERGSMHWRMGIGEAYLEKWIPWYRGLTAAEKAAYLDLFPEPLTWRGWITGRDKCETYREGRLTVELWQEGGKPKYHRSWLCQQVKAGQKPAFLFFWGHHPAKNGATTKSCFSQWWMSDFYYQGLKCNCAEQCMMAGKALLFEDQESFETIIACEKPMKIKSMGRSVKNFDSGLWNRMKYPLVLTANYNKFSQNEALRNFLLSTGDSVLVEASPYDTVWGIGMAADDPRVKDPDQWQGENLLGFALMEVRDELKRVWANAHLCTSALEIH